MHNHIIFINEKTSQQKFAFFDYEYYDNNKFHT